MKTPNNSPAPIEFSFTQAELDALPDYVELCNDCKEIGFCKKSPSKKDHIVHHIADEKLRNYIPISKVNHKGIYTQKHFDAAHLAFHQNDYETAVINYQAIIEYNSANSTAHFCLAITYYFLERYENAIASAERSTEYSEICEKFIAYCQHKMENQRKTVEVVEEKASSSLIVSFQCLMVIMKLFV